MDIVERIRVEIKCSMAQEMAAYKIACEHGWGESSHAPSVYTRLQTLLSFIESLQKESELSNVERNGKNCKGEPELANSAKSSKDSKEEPDLEEASEEYAYTNWQSDDYHDGASEGLPFDPIGHTQKAFKDGAQWQKQQMLKDAVEATIPIHGQIWIENNTKYKAGEKVKIITIKEDRL